MTSFIYMGKRVAELKLPPKFGASALLSHNQIPVFGNREQALQELVNRTKSSKIGINE